MADDTRSMLTDFYGAMLAAEAEESNNQSAEQENDYENDQSVEESVDGYYAPSPQSTTQSSYQSTTPSAVKSSISRKPAIQPELDPDSDRFDPNQYVQSMLSKCSMRELLDADNRLVNQKRSLDSDMQMLVYENYSKFISATDMVRKMKENVESMESSMTNLLTNMQSISQTTTTIEASLHPERARVENLVGVSRLLQRLEFLFELPARLQRSIELGAHAQAVKYFRVSTNILAQYSHLKSFADIKKESEEIMRKLKLSLTDSLRHSHLSTDTQLANTAMLIDLQEPPQPLLDAIFGVRVEKFKSEMRKCVELHAVALKKQAAAAAADQSINQTQSDNQQVDGEEDTAVAEIENNPFADPVEPARKPSHRKTSAAPTRTEVVEDPATDLIGLLSNEVITPLTYFARSFADAILLPIEQQVKNAKKPNQQKQILLETCQTAFDSFIQQVLDEFVKLSKKELLRLGALSSSIKPAVEQASRFTQSLATFCSTIAELLPVTSGHASKLESQRDELVELTIRQCVAAIMEQTQDKVIQTIVKLHSDASKFDSLSAALAAVDTARHAEDNDLAIGVAARAAPSQTEQTKSPIPAATATAAAIRTTLESSLEIMQPVVNVKSYLPSSSKSATNFVELAHTQYHALLHSICQLLTMRSLRKSEGPVFDSPPVLPAPLAAITATEREVPMFYLYLSQLCLYLESKEIPSALRTMRKTFPTSQQKDPHEPKLLARMRENAQILLQKYVEVHGVKLQRQLRPYYMEATSKPAQQEIVIGELPSIIYRQTIVVQTELAEIVPKRKETASGASNNRQNSSLAQSMGSANRELARLFISKQPTFAPVRLNRVDPVIAVLRIALKCLSEMARFAHFSDAQARCAEAELAIVKMELPPFMKPSDEMSDDIKHIFAAIEDVIRSIGERAQSQSMAFDAISEYEAQEIYRKYQNTHEQ